MTIGGGVRRVFAVVMVAAAAVLTGGVLLMTHRTSSAPLSVLVAAFPLLVFLAAAVVAIVAVVAGARARLRVVTVLAVALVVVNAGLGGAAFVRISPPVDTVAGMSDADDELRILSWNTNQQNVSAEQLGALIESEKANVVVLPEYFTTLAVGNLAELADEHDLQIVGSESSAATLLISHRLGTYTLADQETTPPWAGFVATSDDPESPALLIAHLQRPSFADSSTWQSHLDWARGECDRRADLIAVGDFNTTLANLGGERLGRCRDAASALGQTSAGTWPAALPASLGAAIDHTFVGPGWRPIAYGVLDGAAVRGSDHRPIVTVLERSTG